MGELAVTSYGALLAMPDVEPVALVQGILAEGEGAVIASPPNVGKTWLALSLARSVASGTPWLGRFETAAGTVLYVDEESATRPIRRRLKMLEAAEPIGQDAPLHFAVGAGVRFDDDEAMYRLHRVMDRLGPSLVIVDSLTRVHGADENRAGEMALVFGNVKTLMREHGAAFLIIHHTRKKGLLNDPAEAMRGSSEIRAWPDMVIVAEEDEEHQREITLRMVKQRNAARLDPFTVTRDIDPDAGTARLTYSGSAREQGAANGGDFIKAIHSITEQLGPDATDASSLAAWLDVSPSTVQRLAVKLQAAGLVEVRQVRGDGKGRPRNVFSVRGD